MNRERIVPVCDKLTFAPLPAGFDLTQVMADLLEGCESIDDEIARLDKAMRQNFLADIRSLQLEYVRWTKKRYVLYQLEHNQDQIQFTYDLDVKTDKVIPTGSQECVTLCFPQGNCYEVPSSWLRLPANDLAAETQDAVDGQIELLAKAS